MVVTHEFDIIIVGAGLVGASLAAAITSQLENTGIRIAIIDRGEMPQPVQADSEAPRFDPRVVALTASSVGLFERLGVWPAVLAQRACAYRNMTVWDNEGSGEIHFSAQDLAQPQLGFIVENSVLLNEILASLKYSRQVEFFRGQGISEIDLVKGKRLVQLDDGQAISGVLLLAADGGQSSIRELAGMAVRSWQYAQKAIVTTVKHAHSHQYTAWQNFLVSGPLAFLPLDHASCHYSSIVWSVDDEQADSLMALDDKAFASALHRAFDNRLGEIQDLDKRYCFPLIQRHAVEYIAPQLALVGDAAHTIHPLAGQGVNLGLLDVQVLAAEIARASSRQLPLSDASILRRYQRQRKGHNLEVMLLMETFKRLFGSRQLALRHLRNRGLTLVNGIKPLKNWLARQAMGL